MSKKEKLLVEMYENGEYLRVGENVDNKKIIEEKRYERLKNKS